MKKLIGIGCAVLLLLIGSGTVSAQSVYSVSGYHQLSPSGSKWGNVTVRIQVDGSGFSTKVKATGYVDKQGRIQNLYNPKLAEHRPNGKWYWHLQSKTLYNWQVFIPGYGWIGFNL